MTVAKRPTRFKIELVDHRGVVIWDALVTEFPPPGIRAMLADQGVTARRPARTTGSTAAQNLIYSELDPESSIRAAQEFAARRETKLGEVIMLLLARRNRWVDRDAIREVGGDSGDRRVRELRSVGWPIEINQTKAGAAWSCRLVVPWGHDPSLF